MTVSRLGFGDLKNAATSYAEDAVGDARTAATDYAQEAVGDTQSQADRGRPARRSISRRAARQRKRSARKSGGAGDADKTFEELYDRLKRELMIERATRPAVPRTMTP